MRSVFKPVRSGYIYVPESLQRQAHLVQFVNRTVYSLEATFEHGRVFGNSCTALWLQSALAASSHSKRAYLCMQRMLHRGTKTLSSAAASARSQKHGAMVLVLSILCSTGHLYSQWSQGLGDLATWPCNNRTFRMQSITIELNVHS